MEVVGVTTGVMKPLLSKLSKLLEEEYAKFKGVRKQIKFLRDELSAMSATLEMLADAEQLNPEMKLWRDKLRELAYDLEDCIDGFMARVGHGHEHDGRTGFKKYYRKLKRFIARHEIANQVEELKACVVEASERHKRYDFAQLKHNSSPSSIDPRLQALYEDIENLVGIDGPKKHIIELLNMEMNGPSAKLKVVSIAGCGGLGKTTLAKQVYDTIKGQFSCAAFVSVSRTPDLRKILIHIANGVGYTSNIHDDDEHQLIDKVTKYLHDKRYIVVIDDVWGTEVWKLIKLALPNNDIGSRIITTTRSVTVAKCCSSQVYDLEPLSFDDSKRLLFKRAFGFDNSCYPHLEDVPDEILRKCNGLPLAIITISSMLADKHAKGEWDRVLNGIGYALAKNPGAANMTTILSMSYFDIPHHLRTCLLYLSVFPEDYRIEKQCLINRWIAEGFILEEEGQTKYDTGEGYFNDLINRSMIQPVDIKYGQAKACRVHDIILDYMKCKAIEENFVTLLDSAQHGYSSEYKVRRLCVRNTNEKHVTLWTNPILSHVRSVTIFGRPVQSTLVHSNMLRVLDLGGCWDMDNHHLASIEKWFHLKYLNLHSSSINKLPEKIGELQYLQTLDVRGTNIKELPPTIAKLQRLAHLYVDCGTTFPDGVIGLMHSLEDLSQYGIQSYEQGKSLQEFSKLTKLRTLEITWNFFVPDGSEGRSQAEGIHRYAGTLLSSCNLHNVYLTGFPEACPLSLDSSWHPAASCNLCKLCVDECPIYKVPNCMGSLGNLRVLKLRIICVRQEDIEILGAIPSLFFLKLGTLGGTKGRIIIHGSNRFRSLKYFFLYIESCGTALEFGMGSMAKLEHIKLKFHVHKSKCLNGASNFGIQHLTTLSKVEVKIVGRFDNDLDYDLMADTDDSIIRRVARAIDAAVKTLPNHPVIKFTTIRSYVECVNFESALREWNEDSWGAMTEWLKILQIDEEPIGQATDGETEQEDETDEEEEDEQIVADEEKEETNETDEDDQTDEEEEEGQQEDNSSSNGGDYFRRGSPQYTIEGWTANFDN